MTTAPGITWTGDHQQSGIGMPITSSGVNGIFGPNFQFISVVPDESPTWTLLLIALAALLSPKFFLRKLA